MQDAAVAALEVWERTGVPDDPSAWLYVAARRKALDLLRREGRRRDKEQAAVALAAPDRARAAAAVGGRATTNCACCSPAATRPSTSTARVALSLRTLCGLSTAEVARVLLVPEPTMAKRLTRAKRKIAVAQHPLPHPGAGATCPTGTAAVCAVVHLVYTAGHSASGGDDPVRADLCDEAVRLARLVVDLLPDEPSSLGLLALLLLTDARRAGRLDADGDLVPLADQDRVAVGPPARSPRAWRLLDRSLDAVDGLADPYQLQAAIAACHATAPSVEATDWREIERLYGLLAEVYPNPVVHLNAAVARAEVDGPAAALAELDRVDAPGARTCGMPRGEMFRRLDRRDEALVGPASGRRRGPHRCRATPPRPNALRRLS